MKEIKNIAKETGKIILSYYGGSYNIENKIDSSPVTQADKAADKFIRKSIENLYPLDQIISEESLEIPNINKNIRYIDPLDGTKDFINNEDKFSIIIGYCSKKTGACFGLLYFPATKEMMYTSNNRIIYEINGIEKNIETCFGSKVFFKNSVYKYKNTENIISMTNESKKQDIRPSGYGMKEYILQGGNLFILGHGYIYELCAFDAITKAMGGKLLDNNGLEIDYYQEKMKILNGCFIGNKKDILNYIQK